MGIEQILLLLIAGLVLWVLIRTIRSKSLRFAKEDISKSFTTMGVLALILIAFIALCVLLLR